MIFSKLKIKKQFPLVLMFQGSFLDHASPGIFHTAHHHKCIGFDPGQFGIQFIQFQAGNDGIDDLYIFVPSPSAIAVLPHINRNAPSHHFDDHFSDFFTMRSDDGDANIFFNPFYYKVQCFGCREIGDHGIKGNFHGKQVGCGGKNHSIDHNDHITDGSTEFPAQPDSQYFGTINHCSSP